MDPGSTATGTTDFNCFQGQAAELQNLARLHEVQGKVAIVCQQPMGNSDQKLDLTCEIWKALQASPKEVICKLLGKKLRRSEGWKLVSDANGEQLLVGYATYIATDAQQVQEASGRNLRPSPETSQHGLWSPGSRRVTPPGLLTCGRPFRRQVANCWPPGCFHRHPSEER